MKSFVSRMEQALLPKHPLPPVTVSDKTDTEQFPSLPSGTPEVPPLFLLMMKKAFGRKTGMGGRVDLKYHYSAQGTLWKWNIPCPRHRILRLDTHSLLKFFCMTPFLMILFTSLGRYSFWYTIPLRRPSSKSGSTLRFPGWVRLLPFPQKTFLPLEPHLTGRWESTAHPQTQFLEP